MVMELFVINVLVVIVLFPKGGFSDDAGLQELPDAPVDRGAGNFAFVLLKNLDEIFCGKMPVRGHDGVEDGLPAVGDFKPGVVQVILEFFTFTENADCPSVMHSETLYHPC